ncbi:MAG: hypothetical protein EOP48_33230 [Sphingobacteriales bacterium]|nr:MAG: hypothetical protein EOP48_33230 [Sphingobacteriales bacterium]
MNDRVDFDEQAVDDMFDKSLSYEEEQLPADRPQSTDSTVAPVSAHNEESDIVREPFLLPAEHQQPEQPAYQQYQAPAAQPEIKENLVPQTELIVDKVEEKQIPRPTTELQIDKVEEKEMPQATFNSRQESIPQSPGQRPTLNDLLALKGNSSNVEESVKAPITDLKRSITLNEKLLYIKDLFNGYNLAYSEAIDLINKMPDFKTADSFLKNSYAVKNNWEAKPTTVAQFYELLKQRFPEG